MKNNTKTTTQKTNKQTAEKVEKTCEKATACQCQSVTAHENRMIERSILVTSLLVNLFFLIGWVVVASSSEYAHTLGRVIYNL
jgi:hypothetical protein